MARHLTATLLADGYVPPAPRLTCLRITSSKCAGPSWPVSSQRSPFWVMEAKSEALMWIRGVKSCTARSAHLLAQSACSGTSDSSSCVGMSLACAAAAVTSFLTAAQNSAHSSPPDLSASMTCRAGRVRREIGKATRCNHLVELLQAVGQVLVVGEVPRQLHQQRVQWAPGLRRLGNQAQ